MTYQPGRIYREDRVPLDAAREIAESDWAADHPTEVVRCPQHHDVLMMRMPAEGPAQYFRCRRCGPSVKHRLPPV